ncbi:Protein of uncharacterised function (DUF1811) [Mycobacteroides abscessus subsp. abscessus]|nr:Protein of uncharacterised function (DUF1811) [Mycobacteroides abscessus subsp. abscessus]
MLTKRYSMMTEHELRMEISTLNDQAKKVEQLGIVNEYAVLERKAVLAKSYLLNPKDFKANEVYEIEGDPGVLFQIDYMNGVFAWGKRKIEGSQEEGIPIALLKKKD